jgi:hypothetical protein
MRGHCPSLAQKWDNQSSHMIIMLSGASVPLSFRRDQVLTWQSSKERTLTARPKLAVTDGSTAGG